MELADINCDININFESAAVTLLCVVSPSVRVNAKYEPFLCSFLNKFLVALNLFLAAGLTKQFFNLLSNIVLLQ